MFIPFPFPPCGRVTGAVSWSYPESATKDNGDNDVDPPPPVRRLSPATNILPTVAVAVLVVAARSCRRRRSPLLLFLSRLEYANDEQRELLTYVTI
ncbi:hypothetical protein MKZ38_003914 [Zalerion maritima]|uniref:Uncharacterized protein n=1 Tax=Zalerion maritima TaxID=339359 RepID=A0AAD5WRE5_9PEZI|nr:hypothetical protein MKZ38_003914 [Zalerion maritima]